MSGVTVIHGALRHLLIAGTTRLACDPRIKIKDRSAVAQSPADLKRRMCPDCELLERASSEQHKPANADA